MEWLENVESVLRSIVQTNTRWYQKIQEQGEKENLPPTEEKRLSSDITTQNSQLDESCIDNTIKNEEEDEAAKTSLESGS